MSNISPDITVFFIHSAFGGNEYHYAACSDFIKRLHKEVIVNKRVVLIVFLVRYFKIAKRYIGSDKVIEVIG